MGMLVMRTPKEDPQFMETATCLHIRRAAKLQPMCLVLTPACHGPDIPCVGVMDSRTSALKLSHIKIKLSSG